MAVVDLYHVILAGGLQYDVIQIRLITCPSINVVATGVIVTDVTGTLTEKLTQLLVEKIVWQQIDAPFQLCGTFTCILNTVSLEHEAL